MIDFISALIVLIGAAFTLIAGIGLFRLPDVYLRMHAATKAGTLGAGLMLLALALDAQQLEVAATTLATATNQVSELEAEVVKVAAVAAAAEEQIVVRDAKITELQGEYLVIRPSSVVGIRVEPQFGALED